MQSGVIDLSELYRYIKKNKIVPHRSHDKEIYRPFKRIFLEIIKSVPHKTGWYHWVEINGTFKSIYIGKSDSNTSYHLKKRIEEELAEEYVALWGTVYDENIVLNTFNEKYGYKAYNKGRHERAMKKKGATHILWNSVSENLSKETIKNVENKLIKYFEPIANDKRKDPLVSDSELFEDVKNNFKVLIKKIRQKHTMQGSKLKRKYTMESKMPKDPLTGNKMYKIAKYLNDLNSSGEVKKGRQNNYGHATIKKIKTGCVIRVHHYFNNTILIDLLITQSALNKYPVECDNAIEKYLKFQPDVDENFRVPSRPEVRHVKYAIDITTEPIEDILIKCNLIKEKFA